MGLHAGLRRLQSLNLFAASFLHASGSHFSAVCRFPQPLPFVMHFSSAAKSDAQLGDAALKEDLQRDECQSVLVSRFCKLPDLPAFEQELSLAPAVMVVDGRLGVFCDIAADQPDLSKINPNPGFLDLDLAVADAFDLTACEYHSAVKLIQNLIVVSRTTIRGHDLTFNFSIGC